MNVNIGCISSPETAVAGFISGWMYDAVIKYVISKIKLPVMPAIIPAAVRKINDFTDAFSGVVFIYNR